MIHQDYRVQLPRPVEQYLNQLELAIKQRVGVVPENALSDAREFLMRDYEALTTSEPSLGDQELFQHFVSNFGPPISVADAYEAAADPTPRGVGFAPGWRISCTKCGRSAPASRVGITRIGARSVHKYVLGYCRDCRWLRWLRLERDLQSNNLTKALGVATGPEQVRLRRHKPWLALALIAVLVIAPFSILRWFRGDFPPSHFLWAPPLPATQVADNTFSDLPQGWRIDKQIVVPEASLPAFGQKLGGRLLYLSNTFLRDAQRRVQINVIRCAETRDADQVQQTMQGIKRDPRALVRRGNTIFEFVYQDQQQARFAAEARNRLPILPDKMTYQVSFQALPVKSVDAMSWNKLFNLFLALERSQPPSPNITAQIANTAKGFEFSNGLELRRYGLGAVETLWRFQPKPTSSVPTQAGWANLYTFADLPTKASLPVVNVRGDVTCQTRATCPMLASEEASAYLNATEYWPVEDEKVSQLALEVVQGASSDREKLQALLAWLGDETNLRIGGDTGSRYGVPAVLRQRYGNCWDYSDLLITLSRAGGIPARQVLGWLYPGEGHVWCEVLIDGNWQHVDPMTGTGCGSDYLPLQVSSDGRVTLVYASAVAITPLPE